MFAIPGIGRLTVDSVLRHDYPVIQGIVLVVAAVLALSLSVRFASDSLSVGDRNQLIYAAIFFGLIALGIGFFMVQMWKNRLRWKAEQCPFC